MRRRFAKIVLVVGAVFYGGPGLWAVINAHSFINRVEKAPNVHILHDMGAFMVGLAIFTIGSLILSDKILTAFVSLIVVSALDAYVHFSDMHLGGIEKSEPWDIAGMLIVLLLGLAAYLTSRRAVESPPVDQDVPSGSAAPVSQR
ncbi:MAG TPA: hypothetical protein VKS82_02590 [Streptosporangiaceae bacterium]|jgi:hypothetical protein|nr:hypothetical protein [Streptosporangiaceae bacterium]